MVCQERIGPFLYCWGNGSFPVTADSLALGQFVTLRRGERILDLGCGAGLLLLLCAARESSTLLFGVEQEENAAREGRENLRGNGLAGEIVTGDVRTVRFPVAMDVVVTNPPWYRMGAGAAAGSAKTERCSLTEWCAAAVRALRDQGRLAVVYPPERLCALFSALTAVSLEPKRLQLLQHRIDTPPFAVLLEGTKRGRPGLSILPTQIVACKDPTEPLKTVK